MRRVTRRGALLGAVGGALLTLAAAKPAEADFFGGDLPLLSSLVGQSLAQIAQYASMLAQMITMVELMRTELKALSKGDMMALVAFIDTTITLSNQLTNGVRSMSYTMSGVNSQFRTLYPSDMSGTTFAQHDQYYHQWNTEVIGAAQVAARQQTVLTQLDEHVKEAKEILSQSKDASGVVSQLQCVNQMLGLMEAELVTINQSLATTGRVLADMAAGQASDRELSRTKKKSSLTNYTSRGTPVTVPHNLP